MYRYFPAVVLGFMLLLPLRSFSQLPLCNGSVYFKENTDIYSYSPAQPISASNPTLNTISIPGNNYGLAVNANINGAGPSPTFYTVGGSTGQAIQYFNGTTWVNTGHNMPAPNVAGGGNYIYGIEVGTGTVWRYDGTGDAVLILTLPTTAVLDYSIDMAADCDGNFYIIKASDPKELRKYSSSGSLLQSWPLNMQFPISGGGMAISGNVLYFSTTAGINTGVIANGTIQCTLIPGSHNYNMEDFASCPAGLSISPQLIVADSILYCSYAGSATITASGGGAFTWSVLSGNATIIGSGPSVQIAASSPAQIVVLVSSDNGCNITGRDTVTVVPMSVVIDAMPDHMVYGCGTYFDTLHAGYTIFDQTNYYLNWTPANSIVSGANTQDPIIHPTSPTTYTFTISTDAAHGSCQWSENVTVTPVDAREDNTMFTYERSFGCTEDTVAFANHTTTTFGPLSFNWVFGDGTVSNTNVSDHIYRDQGVYNVTLTSFNGHCYDTFSQQVHIQHPLQAVASAVNNEFCVGEPVQFDGFSSFPSIANLQWYFGDGQQAPGINPQHTYLTDGAYQVMLVITDTLMCSDTAYIGLTSGEPHINIGPADTVICEHERIYLEALTGAASVDILWADGGTTSRVPIVGSGVYYATATNQCGVVSDTIRINTQTCNLWLPTAFTPNGDGRNDQFGIGYFGGVIRRMDLRVYNRFGNLVFKGLSPRDKWDGVGADIGTYYYNFWYEDYSGKEYVMKGDVTLIR